MSSALGFWDLNTKGWGGYPTGAFLAEPVEAQSSCTGQTLLGGIPAAALLGQPASTAGEEVNSSLLTSKEENRGVLLAVFHGVEETRSVILTHKQFDNIWRQFGLLKLGWETGLLASSG